MAFVSLFFLPSFYSSVSFIHSFISFIRTGADASSSETESESEESDKDVTGFRCKHCCTTSKFCVWQHWHGSDRNKSSRVHVLVSMQL